MSTTAVRVTGRHIADGKPGDMCACALALAVRDALAAEGAGRCRVEVGGDGAGGWTAVAEQRDAAGFRRFIAELDEEAAEFAGAFDAEDPVAPFETDLTWEDAS